MAKERLDQALVARGLCDSREQAKRLIIAGEVMVNGHPGSKPASPVPEGAEIVLKEKPRFVGRGGLKIEGALDHFEIDVTGLICMDIGASTGGFTDCLLQRGAEKVFAFDVGSNQLVWKIRSDPRVVARERFNVRYMVPDDVGEQVDLIVIDVSFISLTKILGPAFSVLKEGGSIVCLIKPQFELQRDDVGKGGIVRDAALHDRAVEKIRCYVAEELDHHWKSVMDSPITGTDGNREFLAWLVH
jgi:23S rRNA (cytidine1920-2'-O)/16S rRNA (cytidine1409-2'-O)-methyltransferase